MAHRRRVRGFMPRECLALAGTLQAILPDRVTASFFEAATLGTIADPLAVAIPWNWVWGGA